MKRRTRWVVFTLGAALALGVVWAGTLLLVPQRVVGQIGAQYELWGRTAPELTVSVPAPGLACVRAEGDADRAWILGLPGLPFSTHVTPYRSPGSTGRVMFAPWGLLFAGVALLLPTVRRRLPYVFVVGSFGLIASLAWMQLAAGEHHWAPVAATWTNLLVAVAFFAAPFSPARRPRRFRGAFDVAGTPLEDAAGSCLFCYGALETFRGAAQRCPHCDAVNTREDQREFWTRRRGPRRVEATLKALVLVVFLPVGLLVSVGMFGASAGWMVIVPVALVMVLWQTAGLVTQRRVFLPMRHIWMTTCFLTGLDLIWVSGGAPGVAAAGCGLLLLTLTIPAIAVGFHRWRVRTLVRGATRVANAADTDDQAQSQATVRHCEPSGSA